MDCIGDGTRGSRPVSDVRSAMTVASGRHGDVLAVNPLRTAL
jgi:hypothetical protein